MGIIVTTTKKFNIELAKQTNRGALLILEAFKHDLTATMSSNKEMSGMSFETLKWVRDNVNSAIETYTKSLEE